MQRNTSYFNINPCFHAISTFRALKHSVFALSEISVFLPTRYPYVMFSSNLIAKKKQRKNRVVPCTTVYFTPDLRLP